MCVASQQQATTAHYGARKQISAFAPLFAGGCAKGDQWDARQAP
jgi:hypothetical protein